MPSTANQITQIRVTPSLFAPTLADSFQLELVPTGYLGYRLEILCTGTSIPPSDVFLEAAAAWGETAQEQARQAVDEQRVQEMVRARFYGATPTVSVVLDSVPLVRLPIL